MTGALALFSYLVYNINSEILKITLKVTKLDLIK